MCARFIGAHFEVVLHTEATEPDGSSLRFVEHEHRRHILTLTRGDAVERVFDLPVLAVLIVWLPGLAVAPVADVSGVDGEGVLLRVVVLGDAAVVGNQDQCSQRVGAVGSEIANAARVLDAAVERTSYPPQELVVWISVAPLVAICFTHREDPIHDSGCCGACPFNDTADSALNGPRVTYRSPVSLLPWPS